MTKNNPFQDKSGGVSGAINESNTDRNALEYLFQKPELDHHDRTLLIDTVIIPFIEFFTDCSFFPYQREFQASLIYSLLHGKGTSVTALFARQSGKSFTTGKTVAGLGVIIPELAKFFADPKLKRFEKKFLVGVFAPTFEKASIVYTHIKDVFESERARRILSDKSFKMNPDDIDKLKFPNGFKFNLRTANTNANIEGDTYHLIITDETQEIAERVITKSITPMRNFYAGSMIHLGTPIPEPCHFQKVCYINKEEDQVYKRIGYDQRHLEFDYTYICDVNPSYALSIEEDKKTLGEFSDEFRLSYKLEWIDGKGKFLSSSELSSMGVKESQEFHEMATLTDGRKKPTSFYKSPYYERQKKPTFSCKEEEDDYYEEFSCLARKHVFAIDYGKDIDSTVVTIGKVWWHNPSQMGSENRYNVHIVKWLELKGDDHEKQLKDILDFLGDYEFLCGINDATGKGDPLHTRLQNVLEQTRRDEDIVLHPFIFTSQSKHDLYTLFKQEIAAGRFTFPDGDRARQTRENREFSRQMSMLVKEYKNGYMRIRAPELKDSHDDYPTSAALLCWCVNRCSNLYGTIQEEEAPYTFHRKRLYPNPHDPNNQSTLRNRRAKVRFWR